MALLVIAITATEIGCAWRLAHAIVLDIPARALPMKHEWTVTLVKRYDHGLFVTLSQAHVRLLNL